MPEEETYPHTSKIKKGELSWLPPKKQHCLGEGTSLQGYGTKFFLDPEYGGCKLLLNIDKYLPICATSLSRKLKSPTPSV